MEAQVPNPQTSWKPIVIGTLLGLVIGLGLMVLMVVMLIGTPRRKYSPVSISLNNLKNLALAVHNYASATNGMLPHPANQTPPLSWRVQVLKYLDQVSLDQQFNRSAVWDDPANRPVAQTSLRVFEYPESDWGFFGRRRATNSAGWPRSDYGMVSGPGTVNPDDHRVSLDEISQGDGLRQTLLLVECSGLQLAWAEPRDPRVDREEFRIEFLSSRDQRSKALISTWSNSPAVAFADGSARNLSSSIDPQVLKALCTVNGGETIYEEDCFP